MLWNKCIQLVWIVWNLHFVAQNSQESSIHIVQYNSNVDYKENFSEMNILVFIAFFKI